jgi:hypothetical protein
MKGVRSGSEIGFVTPVRVESQVQKIRAWKPEVKLLDREMTQPIVPQNQHQTKAVKLALRANGSLRVRADQPFE